MLYTNSCANPIALHLVIQLVILIVGLLRELRKLGPFPFRSSPLVVVEQQLGEYHPSVHLVPDVLALIAGALCDVEDLFRFRLTCKLWNYSVVENSQSLLTAKLWHTNNSSQKLLAHSPYAAKRYAERRNDQIKATGQSYLFNMTQRQIVRFQIGASKHFYSLTSFHAPAQNLWVTLCRRNQIHVGRSDGGKLLSYYPSPRNARCVIIKVARDPLWEIEFDGEFESAALFHELQVDPATAIERFAARLLHQLRVAQSISLVIQGHLKTHSRSCGLADVKERLRNFLETCVVSV